MAANKKGKLLLIVIPVLLIAGLGGTYAAATMGLLKIPGVTPKSKLAKANLYGEAGAKLYVEPKDEVAQKKEEKPKPKPAAKPVARRTPPPKPTHTVDPQRGAAAIAEVWNGIETEKLKEIVSSWKADDLAQVMVNMDTAKAAQLLSTLEPSRASEISRALQTLSSKVPIKD